MNLTCRSWWAWHWAKWCAFLVPADDVVTPHTRRLWERKGLWTDGD